VLLAPVLGAQTMVESSGKHSCCCSWLVQLSSSNAQAQVHLCLEVLCSQQLLAV
jgi:hypothetical protein